jgi:ATP-binding cassette subfamily B protein
MSSLVEESLSVTGILLGRTMGRGDELVDRFTAESRELAALEVRSRMAGRWRMASVQMSFAIMPALVYWFAGQTSAISVGTLVAFTTLQTRLLFPIGSLLSVSVDLQSSLALFHRIFEYLDLPIDLAERPDPVELHDVRGEVRFEDVTFGYDDEVAPTLDGIDLDVPPGSFTAIVGETGSGKTTLAYLTARLYDVRSGRVTIDGVDVRDASFASLARTVGLVSQDTYLFHATVRENLRFARPDATDEELEAAARAAQIHDLIASLPDGYDTVVGERGYRFSGGEKQRIAIARVVLRNPPVLVLDEATSALDTETERAVQDALDRLMTDRPTRTTIAIAHRLSTIRDADQIVVLDGGRLVERGTHEELLERGGRYAALAAQGEKAPA